MSQASVDDNSSANDRTSSETQKSERTTKTSLATNEGETNDKSSRQDVEKGKENSDRRSASAERTSNSNSNSSNEQPFESSSRRIRILEALSIAEGGLEDVKKKESIKQVDSDVSTTRLHRLNVYYIMIKFCLKSQARLCSDESRRFKSERTTKTSLATNEGESNDAASSVSLIYYVHIVSYMY